MFLKSSRAFECNFAMWREFFISLSQMCLAHQQISNKNFWRLQRTFSQGTLLLIQLRVPLSAWPAWGLKQPTSPAPFKPALYILSTRIHKKRRRRSPPYCQHFLFCNFNWLCLPRECTTFWSYCLFFWKNELSSSSTLCCFYLVLYWRALILSLFVYSCK